MSGIHPGAHSVSGSGNIHLSGQGMKRKQHPGFLGYK